MDDSGDGSQHDHIRRAAKPQSDDESQRQIQAERAAASRHQQAPGRVEQRAPEHDPPRPIAVGDHPEQGQAEDHVLQRYG